MSNKVAIRKHNAFMNKSPVHEKGFKMTRLSSLIIFSPSVRFLHVY